MLLLFSFILDVVCLSTSPLNPWCYYSLFNIITFIPPIPDQCFSPLVFYKCGRSYPNLDLKGENFFFNLCLLMKFFNYPCFWEMLVDNVFICCVQELFGHCTFNYMHCISLLHIAFHLHNCIIYFLAHCIFFYFSFNCL